MTNNAISCYPKQMLAPSIQNHESVPTWIQSIATYWTLISRNCAPYRWRVSMCMLAWFVVNISRGAAQIRTHTHIRWPIRIMFSWICTIWSFTVCPTTTKSSIHRSMTSNICWIQRSTMKPSGKLTAPISNHRAQSTAHCIIRALLDWTISNATTTVTLCCNRWSMWRRCAITFCARKTIGILNGRRAIRSLRWSSASVS